MIQHLEGPKQNVEKKKERKNMKMHERGQTNVKMLCKV